MMLETRSFGKEHAHALLGFAAARFVAPMTIDEATAVLSEARGRKEEALLLAGGTDLIVDRHLLPTAKAKDVALVIDLTKITGFRAIRIDGERVTLSGGVTYWDLLCNEELGRRVPMLHQMAKDVGAVQIQTRGTLAGNLATASPAADGSPALLSLDAELELVSKSGKRRLPLREFFTGYRTTTIKNDEIIASISFDVPKKGSIVSWRKVGTRLAQAISKVALASVVELDGDLIVNARFGMASVAATTHRLPHTASILKGKHRKKLVRPQVDDAVAMDIRPIDDVRSTGEYRLHVAKALVWNALTAPS